MEQRVRDLIESLQKFDLDTRVSEKTTLKFKYDGVKTRLVVECNNVDLVTENQKLTQMVKSLEHEIEDLEGEIDELESEIDAIKRQLDSQKLENAIKSCQSK